MSPLQNSAYFGAANQGLQVGVNYGNVNWISKESDDKSKWDEDAKTCCNVLFVTDPSVDRETIKSAKGERVSGTCKWILENEKFQQWLQGHYDRLWISGDPGRGKTMLSLYVSEMLEKQYADSSTQFFFFFFDSGDTKRNTAKVFLQSALYQLIQSMPELSSHCIRLLQNVKRNDNSSLSRDALWTLFRKILEDSKVKQVVFLLDGLDECDSESVSWLIKKFETIFEGVNSVQPNPLKLFISSRSIVGLDRCPRIDLDADARRLLWKDLIIFLADKVERLSRIDGFKDTFRKCFINDLVEHSEGSFLWLGFVMKELEECQTCIELRRTLEALPKGLFPLYDRLLTKIHQDDYQLSYNLIQVVAFAMRPLTLRELMVAFQIQPANELSAEEILRERVILCRSVLRIEELESDESGEPEIRIVLIHQSLRDYLTRPEPRETSVTDRFRVRAPSSHLNISRMCIQYLMDEFYNNKAFGGRTWDPHDKILSRDHPFLDYATCYWAKHAALAQDDANGLLTNWPNLLNKDVGFLHVWYRSYSRRYSCPSGTLEGSQKGIHTIHILSFIGVLPWVKKVLPESLSPSLLARLANLLDRDGLNPLHYASREGHVSIAALLLEKGAEIADITMFKAVSEGHEKALRILLDNGGNANAKTCRNLTTLGEAAGLGFEDMVRLLVSHGADPNIVDDVFGLPPIGNAAINGHPGVLSFLLPKTCNPARHIGPGILNAITNNDENMFHLLLKKMAPLDPRSDLVTCAIFLAVHWIRGSMLKPLVDHGADPNAVFNDGSRMDEKPDWFQIHWFQLSQFNTMSLLQIAALIDRPDLADYLMELGATMQAKSTTARGLLHLATRTGSVNLLKTLIQKEVNLNMRFLPLDAVQKRTSPQMKRLLEGKRKVTGDQRVNGTDQDGETPLIIAATQGHEAIVRLLLENGVNAEFRDKKGRTALALARANGHDAVVELLKEHEDGGNSRR